MYGDTFTSPRSEAAACPFCGVDLEQHMVGLGEQVFVCEVCMHEVPGPVPGPRRSGGSTRVGATAAPALPTC